MDNAKIAKTLKYLKDCWYSEYYTDDDDSYDQYDEISEVVDYVISDILNCKNEKITDFKVGDIVRRIGSDPLHDDCQVGVVTHVSGASGCIIYVMRSDGSCCDEESIDWYKVGRITWFAENMEDLKKVLEEY